MVCHHYQNIMFCRAVERRNHHFEANAEIKQAIDTEEKTKTTSYLREKSIAQARRKQLTSPLLLLLLLHHTHLLHHHGHIPLHRLHQ